MTYRFGQVVARQEYGYDHGRIVLPKKKLPRILVVLAIIVALPCLGAWLASMNFTLAPEHASATPEPSPAVAVIQEKEDLPQTGPGSETNPEVQRYLHEWMANNKNTTWSVYVEELKPSHQIASVNADRLMGLATLYQLFIPSALEKELPAANWAKTNSSAEESRTVDRCVKDMIKNSDIACGLALASRMGWPKFDAVSREKGYVFTRLNTPDVAKSTARDVAALLKDINSGNGYSPELKEKMLTAMREQRYNKGIPAGCVGCTVYNKTGEVEGTRHDAAIIEHQGKTYIMVILTKGGTYAKIAELTKGIMEKLQVPVQTLKLN